MRGAELLERSGGVWQCVVCGYPFGIDRAKAEAKVGPHTDKHFDGLSKGAPSPKGASSGGGLGGFFDFVGDIIDAITGD